MRYDNANVAAWLMQSSILGTQEKTAAYLHRHRKKKRAICTFQLELQGLGARFNARALHSKIRRTRNNNSDDNKQ
eukprot:1238973-Amphidinium_carterae.1